MTEDIKCPRSYMAYTYVCVCVCVCVCVRESNLGVWLGSLPPPPTPPNGYTPLLFTLPLLHDPLGIRCGKSIPVSTLTCPAFLTTKWHLFHVVVYRLSLTPSWIISICDFSRQLLFNMIMYYLLASCVLWLFCSSFAENSFTVCPNPSEEDPKYVYWHYQVEWCFKKVQSLK